MGETDPQGTWIHHTHLKMLTTPHRTWAARLQRPSSRGMDSDSNGQLKGEISQVFRHSKKMTLAGSFNWCHRCFCFSLWLRCQHRASKKWIHILIHTFDEGSSLVLFPPCCSVAAPSPYTAAIPPAWCLSGWCLSWCPSLGHREGDTCEKCGTWAGGVRLGRKCEMEEKQEGRWGNEEVVWSGC